MHFVELTRVKKDERPFLVNVAAVVTVSPPKTEDGLAHVVIGHGGRTQRVSVKESYAEITDRLVRAKVAVVR